MRYVSVCSGIEAATVAWHPLGWTPVAFSEIEKFPSAVLAHHYPNVPNYGDMTQHGTWQLGPGSVDLLVGGTPCQSFSVAGLRKGLADPRGNLALTYLAIADRLRPRWIVWENVPGVLSSSGGRDFGSFLGALVELGYGFAYRVLDAQWFGVAQRRRRVFVVGHLGDWRRAAAVLLERESLRGDPAPSRAARQDIAGTLAARTGECRNNHEHLIGQWWDGGQLSQTLDAVLSKGQTMPEKNRFPAVLQPVAVPYDLFQITAPVNRQNRQPGDPCHTLARDNAAHPAVAFEPRYYTRDNKTGGAPSDLVALKADAQKMGDSAPHVATTMAVRRLTPVECERLQGFPDGYTAIPWRGKGAQDCPDGPRYRALGNSMAVPCMRWIGERIAQVDAVA